MTLQSGTIDKIGLALLEAKKNFGPVLKDKTNPAFKSKYANLEAVLDAVEPGLTAAGIVVLQPTYIGEDGRMIVRTILLHAPSQQYLASEWKLNPAKQDPQGEGSALTYGRRYSVLTMLGIAPEDDDGNQAARPAPPAAPPRDWLKELAACTTSKAVRELGVECAGAGEWEKFEAQFRSQLDAIVETETAQKNLQDGGLVGTPKEAATPSGS